MKKVIVLLLTILLLSCSSCKKEEKEKTLADLFDGDVFQISNITGVFDSGISEEQKADLTEDLEKDLKLLKNNNMFYVFYKDNTYEVYIGTVNSNYVYEDGAWINENGMYTLGTQDENGKFQSYNMYLVNDGTMLRQFFYENIYEGLTAEIYEYTLLEKSK